MCIVPEIILPTPPPPTSPSVPHKGQRKFRGGKGPKGLGHPRGAAAPLFPFMVFATFHNLPWVREVFLAYGGNFRCWPKAEATSGEAARKTRGSQ